MPASLAGATEISYDLNNHPALRVIEEIIYKYHLNNRPAQEICLSQTKDADRKFFMTTPRLSAPGNIFRDSGFLRSAARCYLVNENTARLVA